MMNIRVKDMGHLHNLILRDSSGRESRMTIRREKLSQAIDKQ